MGGFIMEPYFSTPLLPPPPTLRSLPKNVLYTSVFLLGRRSKNMHDLWVQSKVALAKKCRQARTRSKRHQFVVFTTIFWINISIWATAHLPLP